MDVNVATDVFRVFTWNMIEMLLPVLLITFAVAVFVGALQAMMQIQEQTLSFLPKMLVMFGSFYVLAPWMIEKLINLIQNHIESIPGMW